MKLLLTSAGLTNKTIITSLEKLLNKSVKGAKLAFIPTAANIEKGDKDWLINDLNNCLKIGLKVDIVDISALPISVFQKRLEDAEILLFGGGNTFHLMYWIQKSGLDKILPRILEEKIYIGISAGSCATGPIIYDSIQSLYDEKNDYQIKNGLGLVNFQFIPHLNSPYFDKVRKENIKKINNKIQKPTFALDDNSAIVVNENEIEVVGEGKWFQI